MPTQHQNWKIWLNVFKCELHIQHKRIQQALVKMKSHIMNNKANKCTLTCCTVFKPTVSSGQLKTFLSCRKAARRRPSKRCHLPWNVRPTESYEAAQQNWKQWRVIAMATTGFAKWRWAYFNKLLTIAGINHTILTKELVHWAQKMMVHWHTTH